MKILFHSLPISLRPRRPPSLPSGCSGPDLNISNVSYINFEGNLFLSLPCQLPLVHTFHFKLFHHLFFLGGRGDFLPSVRFHFCSYKIFNQGLQYKIRLSAKLFMCACTVYVHIYFFWKIIMYSLVHQLHEKFFSFSMDNGQPKCSVCQKTFRLQRYLVDHMRYSAVVRWMVENYLLHEARIPLFYLTCWHSKVKDMKGTHDTYYL